MESNILRETTSRYHNRQSSTVTAVQKRPTAVPQSHRDTATARNNLYRSSQQKPQFDYQPNPNRANPNSVFQYRSSRTARVLPHHSRPEPSSKLKLFTRANYESLEGTGQLCNYNSTELQAQGRKSLGSLYNNGNGQHRRTPSQPAGASSSKKPSHSSVNVLRRYKYLAENEYAQSYYL